MLNKMTHGFRIAGFAALFVLGIVLVAALVDPTPSRNDYVFLSNAEGNLELYYSALDGRHATRLTNDALDDMHPRWSPDGDSVVLTSRTALSNSDLVKIDIPSGTEHRLTDDPALDHSPSWSPDGRQIAFVSERDGHSNVFVVNADGSALRQLTHFKVTIQTPQWSPDGTEIVFVLGNNLAIVSADGSTWRKLTNERTVHDSQPDWSPDGMQVAYTRRVAEEFNIHVVDVASGQSHQLTNEPWFDTDPQWSPDGKHLLWLSARADGLHKELYVMDAQGQRIRRLTHDGHEVMTPAWRPDGGHIAFVRFVGNRFTAQSIPADGGEIRTMSQFTRGMDLAPLFRPGS